MEKDVRGPRRMWRKLRTPLVAALSVSTFYFRLPTAPNNARDGSNASSDINNASRDLGGPPVCSDECLWKAGADGTWVQDWSFAREHGQYERWAYPNGPYVAGHDRAFRPSSDSPFLWRTSFRWVDSSSDCPVDIMTRERLCEVLAKLDASRMLFFGDSLTRAMYTAFMNKLGDVHIKPNYRGSFVCGVNRTVEVQYTVDEGGNAFPHSPRGVYELDMTAREFIADASEDERIVAIFNIGAHYHNFTHYREDIERMVDIISELCRPQDLYFFRATNPGHDGCEPQSKHFNWTDGPRVMPFERYDEYMVANSHKFDWDAFEGYNNYAKERIYDHNVRGSGSPIHFLNIWNMTVLRRDGHHAPADCLHYVDPGPGDWWNHLLFTYLKRLSNSSTAGKKLTYDEYAGNCRRVRST